MPRKSSVISGLYGITSPGPNLLTQAEEALGAGLNVLQYRDKTSDEEQRLENAKILAALCKRYGALFIINDDVDLALSVDADGVHIGKDDGAIGKIRARLGDRLLGVSCYNDLERARQAQQAGADYVAFGRFFPSRTKPQAGQAEMDVLSSAAEELSIAIVAIGGITPQNGAALIAAGADSLAVIHGLFGQGDVAQNTRSYQSLFGLPSQVHALS